MAISLFLSVLVALPISVFSHGEATDIKCEDYCPLSSSSELLVCDLHDNNNICRKNVACHGESDCRHFLGQKTRAVCVPAPDIEKDFEKSGLCGDCSTSMDCNKHDPKSNGKTICYKNQCLKNIPCKTNEQCSRYNTGKIDTVSCQEDVCTFVRTPKTGSEPIQCKRSRKCNKSNPEKKGRSLCYKGTCHDNILCKQNSDCYKYAKADGQKRKPTCEEGFCTANTAGRQEKGCNSSEDCYKRNPEKPALCHKNQCMENISCSHHYDCYKYAVADIEKEIFPYCKNKICIANIRAD